MHTHTHLILHNVENIRWPLAGGKCMHFPFAQVQSRSRAFMFAIYKIAIAHIILFLHHRCWIIYTYLQMDTNASHADKTKLQLACVFSLIRTPMNCSVLWSNLVWMSVKCTLPCSILHLGCVCCKMGIRKGGKNDLYFIIIVRKYKHTLVNLFIQAACVKIWSCFDGAHENDIFRADMLRHQHWFWKMWRLFNWLICRRYWWFNSFVPADKNYYALTSTFLDAYENCCSLWNARISN